MQSADASLRGEVTVCGGAARYIMDRGGVKGKSFSFLHIPDIVTKCRTTTTLRHPHAPRGKGGVDHHHQHYHHATISTTRAATVVV
ncbi:hypothetical protein E2C01_091215 [Portunus trituberculatus]|uniref:Uncharacterized protein n=1 Tax=Portunus trituberculatus TaxID=210409 RepID=A0A5B7JIK0_PORTR|nr:hypothetical protein [Portunus trituberculatus]